jgi:hypothetical protein
MDGLTGSVWDVRPSVLDAGEAVVKYRLLQARAYPVIPLPVREWDSFGREDVWTKMVYLQAKIDKRLAQAQQAGGAAGAGGAGEAGSLQALLLQQQQQQAAQQQVAQAREAGRAEAGGGARRPAQRPAPKLMAAPGQALSIRGWAASRRNGTWSDSDADE